MLVLSRKQDERIVIGGNITVTVIEIRKGRVKLGITGPAGVPIHREEIHRKLNGEQAQLSGLEAPDPALGV